MSELVYRKGDLFGHTGLDAWAHGCNTKGKMGAGIAKGFKQRFPEMYVQYVAQCAAGLAQPGRLFLYKSQAPAYVFNLYTQELPGANAHYEYVRRAVDAMSAAGNRLAIRTIGIPKIGCGIGGLEWPQIEQYLYQSWFRGKFVVMQLP
jgi:O-acetyl-ADP-ribose deacetylase (regulator of RNase III)